MSFLSVLPEILFVELLSDWCERNDVGKLDSAFCNGKLRPALLESFSSKLNTFDSLKSDSYLRWIYLRNIKLKLLTLSGTNFIGQEMKYKIDTSNVRSVLLHKCYGGAVSESSISDLFNSCPLLTSICCSKVEKLNDNVFSKVAPSVLSQLTAISIIESATSTLTGQSILHIANHCHHLDSFELLSTMVTERDLLPLIESNPHLTNLHLNFIGPKTVNKLLIHIAVHCPSIEHINLDHCKFISYKAVAKIINKCGKLHSLFLRTINGWTQFERNKNVIVSKSIEINGVFTVNAGEALVLFFKDVTGFDSIFLSNIEHLSDFALSAILAHHTGLKKFGLENCGLNYSFYLLQQIVYGSASTLVYLKLVGAHHVGNDYILDLFTHPDCILGHLLLSQHNTITCELIQAIIAACPSLRVISGLDFKLALKEAVLQYIEENDCQVKLLD